MLGHGVVPFRDGEQMQSYINVEVETFVLPDGTNFSLKPPTLDLILLAGKIGESTVQELPALTQYISRSLSEIEFLELFSDYIPTQPCVPSWRVPPYLPHTQWLMVLKLLQSCLIAPSVEELLEKPLSYVLAVSRAIVSYEWSSPPQLKQIAKSPIGHAVLAMCRLFSTTPHEVMTWPMPMFELGLALAEEHGRLNKEQEQSARTQMEVAALAAGRYIPPSGDESMGSFGSFDEGSF